MRFFTESRQKVLFEFSKKYYKTHKFDYLHQFDHILRVIWWTRFLSLKERADPSITIPAAILHDIALSTFGDKLHAKAGSKMCKPILKKFSYNETEIEKISETISMHSTDDPRPPKTIEARVLFDSDKLDATGPIGLHRWFFEYARYGYKNYKAVQKSLECLSEWKKKYGNPPFFTKTAKKISIGRIRYIERIFKEIIADGKKFENLQ